MKQSTKYKKHRVWSCDFETIVLTKEEIEAGEETYVWCWGGCSVDKEEICVTSNEYRNGNTNMESFINWLKCLNNPTIYFHNLKFDGSFICYWLLKNGFKYSEEKESQSFSCLISKTGVWYSINIIFEHKGTKYKKATIYDSLKKLPFKVSQIAKDFKLGEEMQKLTLDYNKKRSKDHYMNKEEKEYLLHDIIIVKRALEMQFNEGMTKMTTGSDSLNEFIEMIGGKKEFRRLFPVIDLNIDRILRLGYKGGYVYLNPKYAKMSWHGEIGKCQVYDKNSMHPSMMCTKPMPYGLPHWFDGKYEGNEPCYVQHITCRFKVKDRYVPTIQIKNNPCFNDTVYLTQSKVNDFIDDEIDLWLPSPDLEIFFRHYDVWDIDYLGGYVFESKTGEIFNEFIEKQMKIKEVSEGAIRLFAKLKMNATYGKYGTNPDVTGKALKLEDDKLKMIKKTDVEINVFGDEVEVERVELRDPIYLPVALFTTSWSRYDIINTIDKINESYISGHSDVDKFIYCDTDSVHMLGWHRPNIPIHDSKLDHWKLENKNIGAKYLRQKTYIDKVIVRTEKDMKKFKKIAKENPSHCGYQNGKFYYLDVKCAGMPDNIKEEVTYDAFEIGFKSDKKLIARQVKGGVVLLPDSFEIKPPLNYC